MLEIAGAIAVGENASRGAGGQNGVVDGRLGVCAYGFVIEIEEELVFHDGTTQAEAELILVQERQSDAGLVVEPVIGGKKVIAVVPQSFAVHQVSTGRRGEGRLSGPAGSG